MIVLGCDIAFNHFGYCIFENGKYITHDSYKIEKDEDNDVVKYDKFMKFIFKLIKKYKPNVIVSEKPFLGFNARVFGILSELTGILRCYCFIKKIKYDCVHVATYRSKLGIQNKKEIAGEYIKKSYPDLIIKNDDESDAIALAEYGSKFLNTII